MAQGQDAQVQGLRRLPAGLRAARQQLQALLRHHRRHAGPQHPRGPRQDVPGRDTVRARETRQGLHPRGRVPLPDRGGPRRRQGLPHRRLGLPRQPKRPQQPHRRPDLQAVEYPRWQALAQRMLVLPPRVDSAQGRQTLLQERGDEVGPVQGPPGRGYQGQVLRHPLHAVPARRPRLRTRGTALHLRVPVQRERQDFQQDQNVEGLFARGDPRHRGQEHPRQRQKVLQVPVPYQAAAARGRVVLRPDPGAPPRLAQRTSARRRSVCAPETAARRPRRVLHVRGVSTLHHQTRGPAGRGSDRLRERDHPDELQHPWVQLHETCWRFLCRRQSRPERERQSRCARGPQAQVCHQCNEDPEHDAKEPRAQEQRAASCDGQHCCANDPYQQQQQRPRQYEHRRQHWYEYACRSRTRDQQCRRNECAPPPAAETTYGNAPAGRPNAVHAQCVCAKFEQQQAWFSGASGTAG